MPLAIYYNIVEAFCGFTCTATQCESTADVDDTEQRFDN